MAYSKWGSKCANIFVWGQNNTCLCVLGCIDALGKRLWVFQNKICGSKDCWHATVIKTLSLSSEMKMAIWGGMAEGSVLDCVESLHDCVHWPLFCSLINPELIIMSLQGSLSLKRTEGLRTTDKTLLLHIRRKRSTVRIQWHCVNSDYDVKISQKKQHSL